MCNNIINEIGELESLNKEYEVLLKSTNDSVRKATKELIKNNETRINQLLDLYLNSQELLDFLDYDIIKG